jgi:hypothetical protein
VGAVEVPDQEPAEIRVARDRAAAEEPDLRILGLSPGLLAHLVDPRAEAVDDIALAVAEPVLRAPDRVPDALEEGCPPSTGTAW